MYRIAYILHVIRRLTIYTYTYAFDRMPRQHRRARHTADLMTSLSSTHDSVTSPQCVYTHTRGDRTSCIMYM